MLGSPVYGHLAGRLAEDPRPARAILGDGASWDLGLRLFGAVHYLVLTGVAPDALSGEWDDFAAALAAHEAALARFVREQGVQTNETQRCVALVPAFLTVARCVGAAARPDRARPERRAQSRLRPLRLSLRRGHVR